MCAEKDSINGVSREMENSRIHINEWELIGMVPKGATARVDIEERRHVKFSGGGGGVSGKDETLNENFIGNMGLEKEKPAGLDFGPNMRRSSLQNEETDDGVECNKNKMGSVLLEAENTRGLRPCGLSNGNCRARCPYSLPVFASCFSFASYKVGIGNGCWFGI
ncbi:hypothetical protein V6N13_001971 [Hibiscus sabdariffa]